MFVYYFDAFHFGTYFSSYANTVVVFRNTQVWEWGKLPYSSCMGIGWSDEINSCPNLLSPVLQ